LKKKKNKYEKLYQNINTILCHAAKSTGARNKIWNYAA
jgi:hypothetical protein